MPSHILHRTSPLVSAYCPRSQVKQVSPVPAGLYLPSAHDTHLPASEPLQGVWYCPPGQAKSHALQPTAPTSFWNVLCGKSEQCLHDVCPLAS